MSRFWTKLTEDLKFEKPAGKKLRKTKRRVFYYWKSSWETFQSYMMRDREDDEEAQNSILPTWLYNLKMYIYLENCIFSFFYKIFSYIRERIRRIRKIWDWTKILWNEFDWDHAYIWPILQKKLERMDSNLKDGCVGNRKIQSAEIQYVLILINKIQCYNGYPCPYEEQAIKNLKRKKSGNSYDPIIDEEATKLRNADMRRMFEAVINNHQKWWD